jgi:hypothetical protein
MELADIVGTRSVLAGSGSGSKMRRRPRFAFSVTPPAQGLSSLFPMSSAPRKLTFVGSKNFRQRIVLATLSGRPIIIKEIRSQSSQPGLRGILSLLQITITY